MPQTTQTKKNDDIQNELQKMQQKIAKLEQTVTFLKAQLTVLTRVSPDSGEPQPPIFHGRYMEDVLNWLARIQVYICARNVPEQQRTAFAAIYLEEIAWDWFVKREIKNQGPVSWAQFHAIMLDRFGKPGLETLLLDQVYIDQQRQNNFKYIREFQQLIERLPSIPESGRIHFFISGLKQRTQDKFRGVPPNSLNEAYQRALRYESINCDGVSPQQPNSHQKKTDSSQSKKRSEWERCRREKLCFRCKQSGHRSAEYP